MLEQEESVDLSGDVKLPQDVFVEWIDGCDGICASCREIGGACTSGRVNGKINEHQPPSSVSLTQC